MKKKNLEIYKGTNSTEKWLFVMIFNKIKDISW